MPVWELCVEHGGALHPGYRPYGFGLSHHVQLTCDITKAAKGSFDGVCN